MTRGGSIVAALLANRAKVPVTQESRTMDAHTRFQTQIVGALPAIAHYFERTRPRRHHRRTRPLGGRRPPGHPRRGPRRQPPAPAQGPLPRRPVGPVRRPDRLLRPDRRAAQRRPPRPRPGAARRARRGHPGRPGPQGDRALRAGRHPDPLRPDHRRAVRGLRGRDGRGPAAADPDAHLRPDQERPQARQAGPARARRHRRRRRAGRPPAAGRQRRRGHQPPGQPQAPGPHPAQGEAALHRDTKLDAPEEPAGDRRPQGPVPLRRRPARRSCRSDTWGCGAS